MRIGIIGAGAAGLSAALGLRDAGYRNVTVFERNDRAGGKCMRFPYMGRTYELGAAVTTLGYKRVHGLMKRFGQRSPLKLAEPMNADPTTGRVTRWGYVPSDPRTLLKLGWEGARFVRSDFMERRRGYPRLDTAPEHANEPFEYWCNAHGYPTLLDQMRPFATAFGYGYMNEVPAAYMLNYMQLCGPMQETQEGFQRLWDVISMQVDVRYGEGVESIDRNDDGVVLHTNKGEHALDALIIAVQPEHTMQWFDDDSTEVELFRQVKNVKYNVVALDTRMLPEHPFVFLPDHLRQDSRGEPMFWYRRYADRGVVTMYSFDNGGVDASAERAVRLVERMGGSVMDVLAKQSWDYFPHVDSPTMANRFYPRLESLQGRKHTFWVGELFSFSCVETTVRYAQGMVSRYFGKAVQLQQTSLRSQADNDAEAESKQRVA